MSDTPRTDAEEYKHGGRYVIASVVLTEFARQLERELNAQYKENVPIPETCFLIQLVQDSMGFYCWMRNDGERVSALFHSKAAAAYCAGHIPFLTDAEWEQHYPVAQSLPHRVEIKTC